MSDWTYIQGSVCLETSPIRFKKNKDGSWFERHEYDGSEWWEYKEKPAVDKVFNTYFDSMTR